MLICNFLLFFLPNFYAVELLTRHANARSPAVLKKPCSIRDLDFDMLWDESTKNGSDSRAQLGHNTVY